MLKISEKIQIPDDELDFSFVRASGPGGQNVNKTSTAAVLRWNIENSKCLDEKIRMRLLNRLSFRVTKAGEIIIKSDSYRSQERNIQECLDRLKDLVLEYSTLPKKRKPTKASKGSRERRLKEKKAHSQNKALRRKPE